MWPLLVVFRDLRFGELTNLVYRVEPLCVKHLLALGTLESFDKSVLIGLLGSMKNNPIFLSAHTRCTRWMGRL